jgi:hypothetical protein
MCGASMRLKTIETVVQIPGDPAPKARPAREWVCPECDYFEEAENERP